MSSSIFGCTNAASSAVTGYRPSDLAANSFHVQRLTACAGNFSGSVTTPLLVTTELATGNLVSDALTLDIQQSNPVQYDPDKQSVIYAKAVDSMAMPVPCYSSTYVKSAPIFVENGHEHILGNTVLQKSDVRQIGQIVTTSSDDESSGCVEQSGLQITDLDPNKTVLTIINGNHFVIQNPSSSRDLEMYSNGDTTITSHVNTSINTIIGDVNISAFDTLFCRGQNINLIANGNVTASSNDTIFVTSNNAITLSTNVMPIQLRSTEVDLSLGAPIITAGTPSDPMETVNSKALCVGNRMIMLNAGNIPELNATANSYIYNGTVSISRIIETLGKQVQLTISNTSTIYGEADISSEFVNFTHPEISSLLYITNISTSSGAAKCSGIFEIKAKTVTTATVYYGPNGAMPFLPSYIDFSGSPTITITADIYQVEILYSGSDFRGDHVHYRIRSLNYNWWQFGNSSPHGIEVYYGSDATETVPGFSNIYYSQLQYVLIHIGVLYKPLFRTMTITPATSYPVGSFPMFLQNNIASYLTLPIDFTWYYNDDFGYGIRYDPVTVKRLTAKRNLMTVHLKCYISAQPSTSTGGDIFNFMIGRIPYNAPNICIPISGSHACTIITQGFVSTFTVYTETTYIAHPGDMFLPLVSFGSDVNNSTLYDIYIRDVKFIVGCNV